MRPFRALPAKIRALAWALQAARLAQRQLADGGLDGLALPPPPDLPYVAKSGVEVGLQLSSRNCLVRSAVRQAWYAAHGRNVDLVIGVTRPSDFKAHAWLASDPPAQSAGYEEIARRPADGRRRGRLGRR